MKKYYCFLLLIFVIYARENEIIIKDANDLYYLLEAGEISYTDYLSFSQLLINKVDINSDEIFNLVSIPGINIIDLEKIYQYHIKYGNFIRISDLKKIIDNEKYERIKAFIIVIPEDKKIKTNFQLKCYEVLKSEKYDTKYFRQKILYQPNISLYLSYKAKKQEPHTIDYFYFKLKHIKYLEKIVVGNYKAVFGQGLVFGHNLYGTILEVKQKNIHTSFFYDDNKKIIGNNTDFMFKKIKTGITFYYGDTEYIYGWHNNLPIKETTTLFSEIACMSSGDNGTIIGINNSYKNIDLLLLYRNYTSNFNNPLSNGFADDDGKDNDCDEKGVYCELNYKLNSKLQLKTYFDQFQHPSTYIVDNEFFTSIYLNTKKTKAIFSRKWHDEDITQSGRIQSSTKGETIKTNLHFSIFFSKINPFLYISFTEKDVSKYRDRMQKDLFGRINIEYKILPSITTNLGYHYKDTDINSSGQLSNGYFLELKNKINNNIKAKTTFKLINYTKQTDQPNPKISFAFNLYFNW